jgi:hypothetical protein
MTLSLSSFVHDALGAAKVGVTAEVYLSTDPTSVISTTTTDIAGKWEFTGLDDTKIYIVKIIDGLKVLWLDGRSKMQFTNVAVPGALEFIIDDLTGVAITTGVKGFIEVPFACTIQQESLLADQSGAIKIDIWKCTYAQYDVSTHPVNADSICGGNEPEIAASGVKDQDATLTSWTKAITAGSILAINVDSCTSITRCTLSLKVMRT